MRSIPVSCLLTLSLFCATLLAAEPQADERSWPVPRGNSGASGVSPANISEKPVQLWSLSFENAAFESFPVIAEGRVFVGEMNEKLFALNLADGAKLWEFSGKLGFPAAPAVRGDRVYVGDGDGLFHCLEATTGQEIWQFPTEGEITAAANFAGENVLVGSQDSILYCLNAESGKLVWKRQIANQIRTLVTTAEGKAFAAQCDGTLHVVDLRNGEITSSIPLNQPNTTSAPAVLGSRLFFGTEEGSVLALDWKNGKIEWTFEDAARRQAVRSSAAVRDDLVVIGSRGKSVTALSPQTGKKIWTFSAKGAVDCSPILLGSRVLCAGDDGRIFLLEAASGKELWQAELRGGISGGPAVADGKFVFATKRGQVVCFGSK